MYANIKAHHDVISLLRLIQNSMYEQTANQAPVHSLVKAEGQLHSLHQTEHMSNTAFFEKAKSLMEVCEHAGREPGASQARINQFTVMDNVDPDDAAAVTATCEAG